MSRSRLRLRIIEQLAGFRETAPELIEQPCSPGRHARQDEETDKDEQEALKNWQNQTKYPEQDETPTDDVNSDALEFRLCAHDDNNESLADAVLATDERGKSFRVPCIA